MSNSQDLDKTLPDRWRRWVHNPEWDKATHDISFSGTVTESEVKEAHITLKTADYQVALEHALYVTRLFSVFEKARQPSRWQRFCKWLRNLFSL